MIKELSLKERIADSGQYLLKETDSETETHNLSQFIIVQTI